MQHDERRGGGTRANRTRDQRVADAIEERDLLAPLPLSVEDGVPADGPIEVSYHTTETAAKRAAAKSRREVPGVPFTVEVIRGMYVVTRPRPEAEGPVQMVPADVTIETEVGPLTVAPGERLLYRYPEGDADEVTFVGLRDGASEGVEVRLPNGNVVLVDPADLISYREEKIDPTEGLCMHRQVRDSRWDGRQDLFCKRRAGHDREAFGKVSKRHLHDVHPGGSYFSAATGWVYGQGDASPATILPEPSVTAETQQSTDGAPVPSAEEGSVAQSISLIQKTVHDPARAGWFTVYEDPGYGWRVDDGTGTTKSLTFGGSRAESLAEEYAVAAANAMEQGEPQVEATRSVWLGIARLSLGRDPLTNAEVDPRSLVLMVDPEDAHRVGLHDDESDLDCDDCREVLGLPEAGGLDDDEVLVVISFDLPSGVRTSVAVDTESATRRDALMAVLMAAGVEVSARAEDAD